MRNRSILFVALSLALLSSLLLLRSLQLPDSSNDGSPEVYSSNQPLSDFAAWLDQVPDEPDAVLLKKGIRLAEQRRARMLQLLDTDPETALAAALGYAEYERLPEEIQAIVERPFSEPANFDLIVVCDHDPASPELLAQVRLADGEIRQLSAKHTSRFSTSKRSVPLQGIALDGLAAIRPQILQALEDDDRSWALQNLPAANSNPAVDYLTGEPIPGEGTLAIAGGFAFHFASPDSLARFEQELSALNALPGRDVGSAALIQQLASYENGPFRMQEFATQQNEISMLAALETKTLLIIRVAFANHPETPFAAEELESMVNNFVAPSLANFSYNKTTVAVTVTPEAYALNHSDSYPNQNSIHTAAVSAYTQDGNLDPYLEYDFVSVSFPHIGFPWAGLANLGGADQWLQGRVKSETILHELGHNYGLGHADFWTHDAVDQSSIDPVDPNGAVEEYGDIYDVMGSGAHSNGHFHMAAKQFLNWIDSQQWEDLSGSGDNGTYRLYQFDDVSATGLQALRLSKTATSDHYWIGYRKAYPGVAHFDQGAYLVWERGSGDDDVDPVRNRSTLVDTTPGSPDGRVDVGIALGRTYSDPASQLHITPIAVGENETGKYLDVEVNFGSFPSNQIPSGSLAAPTTGEARSPVAFAFTGSDPDGDALAYHWDFGDGTVDQNAATLDHQFPVGGDYTVTLTVSDMKGGTQTYSSDVTISDPITEINVRESGTIAKLYALTANDTHVVAGGRSGTFLRSADGATWTNHGLGLGFPNLGTHNLIWTGEKFLAVGRDYDFQLEDWVGVALTSTDGSTWDSLLKTTASVGHWGFTNVAYDPVGDVTVIVRSDAKLHVRQGQNNDWQVVDIGLAANAWSNVDTPAGLAWTGASFVLGGYNFSQPPVNDPLILFVSANGVDWTNVAPESGLSESTGMRALAHLNNQLMGSGFKTRLVYSSDDGRSWLSNDQGAIHKAVAYAYGNGIYSAHGVIDVAVEPGQKESGEEDIIQDFLSTDGRNWKAIGSPPDNVVYNDRIFFANTFISVGDNGLIHQSSTFDAPEESPFQAWIVGFVSDSGNQGALANPDFDWAPNFMEYALGSDPSDPNSAPTPPQISRNAEGNLVIDIARYAKTEVALSLEVSADMVDWSPLGATTTIDSDTALQLTSLASYQNADVVFVRVKASQ